MFRPLQASYPVLAPILLPLRHISKTKEKSKRCVLTMYTLQGKSLTKNHCVFTSLTIHRINDIVCHFLNVTSERDKQFVDAVFANRTFRWFEFGGHLPQIKGIMVSGAYRMAFVDKPVEPSPDPIEKGLKVQMKLNGLFQDETQVLTAKQIKEREPFDPVLAAFARSESFSFYKELGHKPYFLRLLEKVPNY